MISRKKKFFALSLVLVFASCLLFTGCGTNQNGQNGQSDNNQAPSSQNSTGMNGMNGTNTQNGTTGKVPNEVNVTDRTTMDNDSLHERAEKIADAVVEDIDAVKDARVIISDKMAYVSVSITDTADADASKTLKEEVAKVTKRVDTEIEDVYVMEDADTFTRMKEMVDDIGDGHPISGFMDELKTMFTRVMPTKE